MSTAQTVNIALLFKQETLRGPDEDAIVAPDLVLSRAKLYRIVESYAHRMVREGVKRGDLVSLDTSDSIVCVASVFALSLVGARYIPFGMELLEPGAPSVDHFLRSVERPEPEGPPTIPIDGTWSPKFTEVPEGTKFSDFEHAEDPCWISPSSGTTGRAKYIEISASLLQERVAAIAEDYAERSTRLLMLFRCGSRPYIIRAVAALVSGQTLIDGADPDFARRAGVNFICASPQQIRLWLGDTVLAPKVPVLQVSGARIAELQIQRLLESFERVEDVYGSNETIKAHINVYSGGAHDLRKSGRPGPASIVICDDAGKACPVGETGRIKVKTDFMVQRYLADPEATARNFEAGWFIPGDFGRWLSNGVLEVQGRDNDTVNIEGQKVLLTDLEECLADIPGVSISSCFEMPELESETPLAASLVLSDSAPVSQTVERAWMACVERYGVLATPGTILVTRGLALTPDGVAIRRRAKENFVRSISAMSTDELKSKLFTFKVDMDA